ncbi:HAD-IA family hydrolase [Candidatus Woesearchaeota archaeon]|nr:HAD-IA family hydrolase [Candidatus Woesearchaeota archaeon]
MIEAIIWDIDGVLADTDLLHETAWKIAYQSQGINYTHEDYLKYNCGTTTGNSIELLLRLNGKGQDTRLVQSIKSERKKIFERLLIKDQIKPHPDALEALAQSYNLGLRNVFASSSSHARQNLQSLRLRTGVSAYDVFDAGIYGEQDYPGKPAPYIFQNAALLVGASPDSALVIEDSISGVRAAKSGGFSCLAVARNNNAGLLLEAGADFVCAKIPRLSHKYHKFEAYAKPQYN